MDNLSKVNGLNLTQESTEDLELLLRNEIYMDIDSEFAKEIIEELEQVITELFEAFMVQLDSVDLLFQPGCILTIAFAFVM